jgi:hypothetical protein
MASPVCNPVKLKLHSRKNLEPHIFLAQNFAMAIVYNDGIMRQRGAISGRDEVYNRVAMRTNYQVESMCNVKLGPNLHHY